MGTMSVTEVAVTTGKTFTHVYNLLRLGRFQGATKVNGEWKIPRKSVVEYIEERKRRTEKLAA